MDPFIDEVVRRSIRHARLMLRQGSYNWPVARLALRKILADLEADGSEWALKELATLRTKSPTSCKVSLRLLEEGAKMRDFAGEMGMEYALVTHVAAHPDFAEGVRALLIDKDNAPAWQPAKPEDVTGDMIDALFAPLPADEAWTPLPLGSWDDR